MAPDSRAKTLKECEDVIELVQKDKLDDAIKKLQRLVHSHDDSHQTLESKIVLLHRKLTASEQSRNTMTREQAESDRSTIAKEVFLYKKELEDYVRDKPLVDLDISESQTSSDSDTNDIKFLLKQFLAKWPQYSFSVEQIIIWSRDQPKYAPLVACDPLELDKLLSAMLVRGEIDRDPCVSNSTSYKAVQG